MDLCVRTFHNNDISIFETSSSCFSDLDVEPYVVTSALTLVYQACSSSCHLTSALTLVYQDLFFFLSPDICLDLGLSGLFFFLLQAGFFAATYPSSNIFPAFCPVCRISSNLSVPVVNILKDLVI